MKTARVFLCCSCLGAWLQDAVSSMDKFSCLVPWIKLSSFDKPMWHAQCTIRCMNGLSSCRQAQRGLQQSNVQVIDDPGTDNLLLVMEYIDGGTLEQPAKSEGIWERIPEKLVQKHVRDICRVRFSICL